MTNSDHSTQSERQDGFLPWRSFGSVAAALVAQSEARRNQTEHQEDQSYVPVAWAAE